VDNEADNSLQRMCLRIQARAIRRCGELLKTYEAPGTRTDKPSVGAHTKLTQRQAAEGAGLSKHQQVQAVRVANVPSEDFDVAVEGAEKTTLVK